MLSEKSPLVILLDVDNTLLDNDRFGFDLGDQLEAWFGREERERYWAIYEKLRGEVNYADYLGALQLFRPALRNHPDILRLSHWVLEYPFAERVYPRTLGTVAHLRTLGRPVIFSAGDVVFQPRKVERSGLWDALQGDVLIYVDKVESLGDMQQRYPAEHYVMVDDKPDLLAAIKTHLGDRVTTVFVRQGKYAAHGAGAYAPLPDHSVDCIGELTRFSLTDFLPSRDSLRAVD